MRSTPTRRAIAGHRRDPANELYDRACDVVAAAAELRDAASRDNNDAAVAASLGCLEAALSDIAGAIEELRDSSLLRIARARLTLGDRIDAGDTGGEFDAAVTAVRAAGAACNEVRGAVGPLLAELTTV